MVTKRTGIVFLLGFWLLGFWATAGLAGEWTVDLRLAGGDFSSDMAIATERVTEGGGDRTTFGETFTLDFAPASAAALSLRRFWSPRWASSLRVRHSALDLDALRTEFVRFENLQTGEVREFTFDSEIAGRTETMEVALGMEYHPAPEGRVDPFFGVSAGTVRFSGESQDVVESIEGDYVLGATAGLDIELGGGDSYLSLGARWDSWDAVADWDIFLGSLTDVLRRDDDLTAVTLEAGLGVRFGSGGD